MMSPLAASRSLLLGVAIACSGSAQRFLAESCGDQPHDRFAYDVAPAGDVDADGTPDWVASGGGSRGENITGYARVFSGSDGHLIWEVRGPRVGIWFGASSTGIGDFDGDGHDDVGVAAPLDGSGSVHLYSGRTGQPMGQIRSPIGHSDFGWDMVLLGDLDDDGVGDLVVTANQFANVISGATHALMGFVPCNRNVAHGPVVANAKDVNGDGYDDFIVAGLSRPESSVTAAEVFVYSGRDRSVIWNFPRFGDDWWQWGSEVGGGGDVDGDGVPDVVVSCARWRDSAGRRTGAAFVLSGATGLPIHQFFNFGNAKSTILDDLNGDGNDDYLMAGSNTFQYHSGATGQIMVRGRVPYTDGPRTVARIGDVDGDGIQDFAIGYPLTPAGPTGARGCARAYSGQIIATAQLVGQSCGSGTRLPDLNATRPALGGIMVVQGDRTPAGTTGILFLGPPLDTPFQLSDPACFLHVGIGSAVALQLPGLPSWTLNLPIPNVMQLVGLELGMQAVWFPTPALLGFDLTNAVRVRAGV